MQDMQDRKVRSLGQEDRLSRKWQPTPVLLPGKFHGQRSLSGYSPRSHKESDTTEHTRRERSNLSSVLSRVRLLVSQTARTAACQASLSITSSWGFIKFMSTESVMPSNHLILCCPLLLPPSIFPNIRVFSKESILHIR